MKALLLCLGIILNVAGLAQQNEANNRSKADTVHSVSFTVRFHISDLDKDDAAVLKGYVVNIGYDKAKSLDGKKIRITGRVTLITSTFERQPGQPIPQERQGPYKYIASPQIEIIR